MEQERKTEKWLRAYAKKRRGQAGESFKLDPATRRILQSEVSNSARPEDDDTLSLWQVLRQQWVFLLGFAACIFVIATFFFQTVNTATKRAEMATTTANLREIGSATHTAALGNGGTLPATLDALTNGYLSEKQLAQMKNGKAITYVGGGKKLSDLPNNAVIAYSKEENDRRGVVFADESVHYVSETNFVSLTNSRQPELAYSGPAMTPPASAMPSAPAGANFGAVRSQNQTLPQIAGEGGELRQSFAASRQIENRLENSFMNTTPSSLPCSPVLRNFQVSQNGNLIRVVDQDGSVYSGMLEMNAAKENEAAPADKVEQNGPNSTIEGRKMGTEQTDNAPGQAAQSSPGYAFRVQGMNKTFKQSVLFTGTLLGDLTIAKDVQQSFGWSANAAVGAAYAQQLMKSEQTNQAAQLPWSRLRITGTAIINNTNRIEVNATPVTPAKKTMGPK